MAAARSGDCGSSVGSDGEMEAAGAAVTLDAAAAGAVLTLLGEIARESLVEG